MSSEESPAASVSVQPDSFVTATPPSSNLIFGIIAGGFAALIGAIVWAGITYATNMVIGYIAIGVGFLVGLAMRKFGRGSTQVFGIAGAMLALAGCLLGDLLAGVAIASKEFDVSMAVVFQSLHPDIVLSIIKENSPIGWLIYGIAVYTGYKYSIASAPAA